MGFLIIVAACIAGLFVGGCFGDDGDIALGFFAGLAIGIAFARQRTLAARIDALQAQLVRRGGEREATPAMQAPRSAATPPSGAAEPLIVAPPMPPAPPIPSAVTAATPVDPVRAEPARVAIARVAHPPAQPDLFDRLSGWVRRWFSEGNVPVKVGMLVLFAGVAALLKYAAEQGWFTLPIEFRLVGIALAAMAALAFGWRERLRRRSFGLALQGGAIGVLLMTVFAAFRLYHLLPPALAFGLMLVLVAGAGVLAVLQDALALAVLGILAGFAAPILISTGNGDHVVLFSYYALLNLAIFAIAWLRPWRALNLLGFFFTFAIGTAWGVLRYEHALFASTEPFLVLFFAIYLAVPILYARRREPRQRDIVDGTLVFGNPLAAFALQAALLEGERMPLAYSALVLAALYALLAWRQMPRRRVLGESFVLLAAAFATLAVPLAVSARSTSCMFALEGAALVWLGLRQQRRLPRIAGLALQGLAAIAFAYALTDARVAPDTVAIANGSCISALLIATAAFASAWLYHRDADARHELCMLLYLWGLAWWLGAGLREIDRFVPASSQVAAVLGFAALGAALAALATHRTRASATAWTSAIALASGVLLSLCFGAAALHPFEGWGLAAFAGYALAGVFALSVLGERDDATPTLAHVGWLWTWTCALAVALHQLADEHLAGAGWRVALAALPLLAAWAVALLRPRWIAPPLNGRFAAWRGTLLLTQVVVAVCLFCTLLVHEGASAPLPWLPMLNPLELVQLGLLASLARWLVDHDAPTDLSAQRAAWLAGAAFAFVTAATLRSTHHLGGIPWDAGLWSSNLAQTALTVVWSALGVFGWVLGSRRGNRPLWLAGALLMGVVLAKLLLVDRSHLGNLFGIASFIAYGLLCTVIGYFAPAPPSATPRPEGAAASPV